MCNIEKVPDKQAALFVTLARIWITRTKTLILNNNLSVKLPGSMALKSKIPPGKKILLFLVEVYGFVFISLKTKESLSPPKGKYVGRFFDRRNSKHLTLKSKILMENIKKIPCCG